ncbi:MAG: aldehyde dehydrogenase family protein [Desulfurococcales archaeon]|jgi:succinyl-CoA reductase|nr:aldehyde dehydrogenase family protein [Desulfurococcales archaeon]
MRELIIGGERIDSGSYQDVISPGTGEAIDRVSIASDREMVRRAIDIAYETFEKFSREPLVNRIKILKRAADLIESSSEELARILSMEAGKPIRDARVEISRAVSLFRIAAEEARMVLEGKVHRVDAYEYPPGNENRIVMEVREPIGVVGAILPFNFPANSFAHKVAPNIAVGNTVVVKPASATPISALELASILYRAGLPKGVLSVLPGPASIVGDEIVSNRKVHGITFTGSTATGVSIASKAVLSGKRIMMEMGGSDPIIVLEDADVVRAAQIAARARYEYAGQNCNAGKRIIVHEKIRDKFVEAFLESVKRIRVGDPLNEESDMGPVISEESLRNLQSMIRDALEKGGKLLHGGDRMRMKGFYLAPTVIYEPPRDARVMREEVFGPIAPITGFSRDDEAAEIANMTDYGLQAAIFTRDIAKALRIARELEVGGVMINDSTRLRWDALPFGGVKLSGLGGREGVRSTILNLTEVKIVSINIAY